MSAGKVDFTRENKEVEVKKQVCSDKLMLISFRRKKLNDGSALHVSPPKSEITQHVSLSLFELQPVLYRCYLP